MGLPPASIDLLDPILPGLLVVLFDALDRHFEFRHSFLRDDAGLALLQDWYCRLTLLPVCVHQGYMVCGIAKVRIPYHAVLPRFFDKLDLRPGQRFVVRFCIPEVCRKKRKIYDIRVGRSHFAVLFIWRAPRKILVAYQSMRNKKGQSRSNA